MVPQRTRNRRRRVRGFTLIELLVVVAIIGILASIAIVNMLNARVKAMVSRVSAELRTLSFGCDAYFLDNSEFPPNRFVHPTVRALWVITTPVAYVSEVAFTDPFRPNVVGIAGQVTDNPNESYLFFNYQHSRDRGAQNWIDQVGRADIASHSYCLASWGPDQTQSLVEWMYVFHRDGVLEEQMQGRQMIYDPTNGLKSKGDIARFGGEVALPLVVGD